MTEYSLDSPFRTIYTFTLFDGAGGGAVTGAGGGGAGGRTGSGIIRPISRSLMRRFGSEFVSVGRLRNNDSFADIRRQQNLWRLLLGDLDRYRPGDRRLSVRFTRDLINRQHLDVLKQNVGIALAR